LEDKSPDKFCHNIKFCEKSLRVEFYVILGGEEERKELKLHNEARVGKMEAMKLQIVYISFKMNDEITDPTPSPLSKKQQT
jgi:hypothetical protein